MSEQEIFFTKIIPFLEKYQDLIDCHLVDFLTDNLWSKCLPNDLKYCIEENGQTIIREIELYDESIQSGSSVLQNFLKTTRSMKLENCPGICLRENFISMLNYPKIHSRKPFESEFMKVKKSHEVDVYTRAIVWLIDETPSIIIDAGSGKGYSSLHLSNYYSLPVLAIECSQVNHKGAIAHQKLVNKKVKQSKSMVRK